jgi:group I intron endonuclease
MASGIYRIRNKLTGHSYIGQTINLEIRWQYHIIRLRTRVHKSKTLQHDFNLWLMHAMLQPTEFPFIFEILLECPTDKLEIIEELFIAALQPEYNTHKHKAKRATLNPTLIARIKEKYK